MMSWRQGLWRCPGHFLIWAAVPHLVAYPLYALGVHNAYLALIAPGALVVFALIVLTTEIVSTANGVQTAAKGVLDLIAKVAGFTTGLLTWQWWWF